LNAENLKAVGHNAPPS
jgi:hypothetical protein